jgi:hypothetical protein
MALLLFREEREVNESMNTPTESETRMPPEPPGAGNDPGDPRECELEADQRTPEEAGYGYGV